VAAAVEDAEVDIASLESETQSLARERDLVAANEERIAEIEGKIAERRERLAAPEAAWTKERALVEEILKLRDRIAKQSGQPQQAPTSADAASVPPAAEAPKPNRLEKYGCCLNRRWFRRARWGAKPFRLAQFDLEGDR
jgi:hypothetical protein